MPTKISKLSEVHPSAEIGNDVEIGPFCCVGPDSKIGDGTKLDSHVVISGRTIIGERNRFFPGCVIGGEPQDVSYSGAATGVKIGNDNIFREGVTVNRGAEKEDHWTHIGDTNMLMANAHVAHNCVMGNNIMLVNGVLLGGHVHIHDRAIISGNSGVHHFTTVGTMAFVGGCSRVTTDVPPYMMACGADAIRIRMVNVVGLQRGGISPESIVALRRAHRVLFHRRTPLDTAKPMLTEEFGGTIPFEVGNLFKALDEQRAGRNGRAREAVRIQSAKPNQDQKKAA
jgi:UDP-N-acetylglucosamine acyltransferase